MSIIDQLAAIESAALASLHDITTIDEVIRNVYVSEGML